MGEMLIERRLITQSQLDTALEEQREKGGKLGEILVARGWIDRLTLGASYLDGRPMKDAYRVGFYPEGPVFRLPRKLARVKAKVTELERMVAWFKDLTAELTRTTGSAAA